MQAGLELVQAAREERARDLDAWRAPRGAVHTQPELAHGAGARRWQPTKAGRTITEEAWQRRETKAGSREHGHGLAAIAARRDVGAADQRG